MFSEINKRGRGRPKKQSNDDDDNISNKGIFKTQEMYNDTSLIFNMNSDSSSDSEIEKLKSELDKKETIINNLKSELSNMKNDVDDMMKVAYKEDLVNDNNSVCWWCAYDIKDNNYKLPMDFNNNCYRFYGNFCSIGCVAAFNLDLRDSCVNMRHSLIKKYYDCDNVKLAPERFVFEKFGGILTHDEYLSNQHTTYKYIVEPNVSFVNITAYVEINKYVPYDVHSSEYVMKRIKPLERDQNVFFN